MPAERNEQERREIIRRLEQEDRQLAAKAARADAVIAEARRQRDALHASIRRAKLPFPSGDICPECWIVHGVESPLKAVTADDPSRYDRWKCSREGCGYFTDREVR